MSQHDAQQSAKPEGGSSGFTRECLGYVWVDSGQLVITDPNYMEELDYDTIDAATNHKKRAALIMDGMAAAVRSGIRNGKYPVYVLRFANGVLAKVEIDMTEGVDTPRED